MQILPIPTIRVWATPYAWVVEDGISYKDFRLLAFRHAPVRRKHRGPRFILVPRAEWALPDLDQGLRPESVYTIFLQSITAAHSYLSWDIHAHSLACMIFLSMSIWITSTKTLNFVSKLYVIWKYRYNRIWKLVSLRGIVMWQRSTCKHLRKPEITKYQDYDYRL